MNIIERLKRQIAARFSSNGKKYGRESAVTSAISTIVVNENTALKLPTYWACVSLLSDAVGSLPLMLYRRTPTGREIAHEHQLYRVMHDSPCADMTASEWSGYAAKCLAMWGNFYAKINKDVDGIPYSAIPLRPELVRVYVDGPGKYFEYWNPITSRKETYKEDQILHIPGFGYDGIVGYSAMAYAAGSVALASAINATSSEAFNQSTVRGKFTTAAKLTESQRADIRKTIDDLRTTGMGYFILDNGMTLDSLNINPVDLQMIESKAFSVEDICRFFRVPPHMVGHNNVTTWGTGIEELSIGFVTHTLQPSYLTRIQNALNKRFLPLSMQSEYYFEFKVEGLLRANLQAQALYMRQMADIGIYTINEMRRMINMSAIPGGDEHYVQVNRTTIQKLSEGNNGD